MPVRALGAVVLCALSIAACFVSRPSDQFACSGDTDCTDNRKCRSGYCVVPQCPSGCTDCDEDLKTCTMDCSSSDNCGSVTCPTGWTCAINCIGDGACDNVTCDDSSTCAINCSGTNACNNISCRNACACDLTCASGACDAISCPTGMAASKCTTDGMTGSPCVSSAAGCTKC